MPPCYGRSDCHEDLKVFSSLGDATFDIALASSTLLELQLLFLSSYDIAGHLSPDFIVGLRCADSLTRVVGKRIWRNILIDFLLTMRVVGTKKLGRNNPCTPHRLPTSSIDIIDRGAYPCWRC